MIENLCNNAIKYGSKEAPVTITAEKVHSIVRIKVHNEGNPIAPKDLAVLFVPFRRSASAEKSGQKGWGIGLTLVRGIAEAHGGTVPAESSVVNGTTFIIELPLNEPK